MAKVDYGIQSITIAKLAQNGTFPDFEQLPEADKISIQMIDIDSFEPTEEENQSQEVEFENADTITLPGTKGKKGFVFTSSNKEDSVMKFLKGMKNGTGTGEEDWLYEDPDHDDSGTYAVQVITKALSSFPAKVKQYTPVLVTVKENGAIGKNNLGKFSFTCNRQPNFDATGKPIAGFREKPVPTL